MAAPSRRAKTSRITIYSKAPLIEALSDFVVQMPDKFKVSDINKAAAKLKADFPLQEKIFNQTVSVAIGSPSPAVSAVNEQIGLKLTSLDKRYILQLRNSGFTFSEMNAYKDWATFKRNLQKFWTIYAQAVKPVSVRRIALRYINRIDVPKQRVKIDDYFTTYPCIFNNDENTRTSGFFMQVQLPQNDGGHAVVSQALTAPSAIGTSSFVFDIDVFAFGEYAPTGQDMWRKIQVLRKQKNAIFERSITDKTRDLIR